MIAGNGSVYTGIRAGALCCRSSCSDEGRTRQRYRQPGEEARPLMSSIALPPLSRAIHFYEAPIGKKAVMAATGIVLFGYVVGHLLGNLQIYSSNPEQINNYAAFLHNPSNAVALWGISAFLLLSVSLHIIAATQ